VIAEQRRESQYLAERPEGDIESGDIAEISDFSDAVRGRFYRPIKRHVTLRMDADQLEWVQSSGREVPNTQQSD
jgi:uncharacterized protein (DUF4415 family)